MTEPKPTYLGNVTSEQVVLARDYEALEKKTERLASLRVEILARIARFIQSNNPDNWEYALNATNLIKDIVTILTDEGSEP